MEEQSKMEKAAGGGVHYEFDEREEEVCEILLNLGKLISGSGWVPLEKQKESELREGRRLQPFTVVWGAKKILAGSARRNSSSSTTAAPPSQQQQVVKVVEATSPDTTLSFSPSYESDDISNSSSPTQNQNQKAQNRRKREELAQTVEELSECRERLRKAVSATCRRHEAKEESNLEIKKSFDSGVRRCGQLYQTAAHQNQNERQQFMVNPNPMAMPMPMIVESQPQPQPQPQGKLQYHQCPSPVVYGQVGPAMFASSGSGPTHVGRLSNYNDDHNGIPKKELGGLASLAQLQSSVDYGRASAESKARVKAAEARRYRKMMVNRQRLQIKLKSKF